jgi:hypothetical protein
VKGRREGKWVHYSLVEPADPSAREIFDATLKMLKSDKSMTADRKRLVNVCCSPQPSLTVTQIVRNRNTN